MGRIRGGRKKAKWKYRVVKFKELLLVRRVLSVQARPTSVFGREFEVGKWLPLWERSLPYVCKTVKAKAVKDGVHKMLKCPCTKMENKSAAESA